MLTSWRMLREERDLRLLLTAGFVSGLGDWFHTVAVLALISMLTLSMLGAGLAVEAWSARLLGLVAGAGLVGAGYLRWATRGTVAGETLAAA